MIKQIFKQHLIMKGIWNHYEMKDSDFDIIPVPPSYFAYLKNSEMLEAQFTKFSAFAQNINTEKPVFSKRMALKEGLGWPDDKINLNNKWLDEEMGVAAEAAETEAAGLGANPEAGAETPAPEEPPSKGKDEIEI
jgi:hypothetical protein